MHRNEAESPTTKNIGLLSSGSVHTLLKYQLHPYFRRQYLRHCELRFMIRSMAGATSGAIHLVVEGCAKRKHAVHVNLRCRIAGGTVICRAAFVFVLHVCILTRRLRKQELIWTQWLRLLGNTIHHACSRYRQR